MGNSKTEMIKGINFLKGKQEMTAILIPDRLSKQKYTIFCSSFPATTFPYFVPDMDTFYKSDMLSLEN